MAQIAIPLVIAGALYLMSNDKKEEFTNPLVLKELKQGDFKEDDLYTAIISYQKRERRFGKTSEQIK
jgi:hypothetical protein